MAIKGDKMNTIKAKDKKIVCCILEFVSIISFVFFAIYVGKNHEPWADEAQSWLIARDNSLLDIFKTMRYEGTPALWHVLLKICMIFGMEYKFLYIVPIISTTIGIFYLYKNENIPFIFKLLLPFTYFIFFQYTVVARSYTLLFPLLMMIAYIYKNKEKNLITYGILLFLLMNVSLHSFLLAGRAMGRIFI